MALQKIEFYSMSECLRVQMDGTQVCEVCDLFGTKNCGGKNILKTGKNNKGYKISESGLTLNETKTTKKKRKKKKKK